MCWRDGLFTDKHTKKVDHFSTRASSNLGMFCGIAREVTEVTVQL